MDSKVKQQWIEALRSKNYQQTTNYLRTQQGYCCLGVLCDLYAKEHNGVGWDVAGDVDYEFLDEIQTMPEEVKIWAGLYTRDPYFFKVDEERNIYLAEINDEGASFEEIAQLIEEKF